MKNKFIKLEDNVILKRFRKFSFKINLIQLPIISLTLFMLKTTGDALRSSACVKSNMERIKIYIIVLPGYCDKINHMVI